MEDLDDNTSVTEFEPLFIKEEDADPASTLVEQREFNSEQRSLPFLETQLNQSSLIRPYLQEMDDLLKSCEKLTGLPFDPHFSETLTSERIQCNRTDEVSCLSTSYMDTTMDGAATEDQAQGLDHIINRCGATSEVSQQTQMPLTLVGNKLSSSMMEYEGQLLGMLAMLEGCMEETGMDFEPQDWATDTTQEYVHISTNSNLRRGTTLIPIKQEKLTKLDANPLKLESCAGPLAGDKVSKENRDEMAECSAAVISQTYPVLSRDNIGGKMDGMERLGGNGNEKTDQEVLDDQSSFLSPTGCMSTNTNILTKREVKRTEEEDTEELSMDLSYSGSGTDELSKLGSQMEECIEEVQQLEKRRKELLAEVLELRGSIDREELVGSHTEQDETEESTDSKATVLMNILRKEAEGRREERKKEIQFLWQERAEEEKRIWKVNLERQALQEELRKLKKRLFAIARDCAHSQVALNAQHREVDLLKREEEKMKSLVLQLTEEISKLRAAHQQQVLELQTKLQDQSPSQTVNTLDEMTQYKRHSCGDIQQYLEGGLKALEDREEKLQLKH
ncbi:uncharacterized protein sync isoform X2 [Cheilinus undulatus]|uniref:uncharacterized protein sync isoform X2 n=1 Tax=Cheilinus undulatus TaxID=241271 RepID=UPI001BD3A8E9|nr:uncharacterized protein sync isoform X2 [Cheilinus undulatus]